MKLKYLILLIIIHLQLSFILFAQEWRVLPIRSKIEFENNMPGGEGEQHPHSIARSLNNPDYIYLSQDVGGCWKSINAGETWEKTIDKGLFLNYGQSIQVDPNNPDIVFLTVSNSYFKPGKPNEGLYRSTDGGENWVHVLKTNVNFNHSIHRRHRQNIAYDLTTAAKNQSAKRWYAAFPNNGIYTSEDGGINWSNIISSLSGHETVYFVQPHPYNGKTVYVGTSKGFLKSDSLGYGLKKNGDLPNGEVTSIAINSENPNSIFVVIRNGGLYKSENGGINFNEVTSPLFVTTIEDDKFKGMPANKNKLNGTFSKIIINQGFPNKMYLIGMKKNSFYSNNGGIDWFHFAEAATFPGLGRETGWRRWIDGDLSGLVPNSKNENEFVVYSRSTIFKSSDGGNSIRESAAGWTGYAWSWWTDAAVFNKIDSDKFAFFNCDGGMTITYNGGDYFEENTNLNAKTWFTQGRIKWLGTYSGDFQPIEGSTIMVASIGYYWKAQLMRTENDGKDWTLVTEGGDDEDFNIFIAFHPNNPNFVYAGNKISTDAGKTFSKIKFPPKYEHPTLVGMCNFYPDVVYAIDRKSKYLIRSNDRGETWREYAHENWLFRSFDSMPLFAVDPNDPDKIYIHDEKSDLARFDGKNWQRFNILKLAGGHDGINSVRSVAVDPNYPNIIYAGTFEMGTSNIFRTLDGGETWEDISYNLPRNSVTAIKVNPHSGELYRGSSNGTWIFPAPEAWYPIGNNK